MLTVEELNSKIQDWQDKDALKKMSKDDLIEVIPCLIDGIKAHSVALEDACKTILEMSKLLSACAKEVNDPIFGLLLTPFNVIAEASLEKAVNDYLTSAIMETCECEEADPEEYIKACRADKTVSDAELLAVLKKLMGIDGEK